MAAKRVVVAEAQVPISQAAHSIVQVLQHLLPDKLPTATAARMACRRSEVLINGVHARTTSVVGLE